MVGILNVDKQGAIMTKKSTILAAVLLALGVSACATTHRPPSSKEAVYLYSFSRTSPLGVGDAQKNITQFLGARPTADLYRSPDNTVYYVSPADVTETFEQDLDSGNFTFKKSMKAYMGDARPHLPERSAAIAAAETFLHTNRLAPADEREMRLAHYGGLRSTSVIDGRRPGAVIDKLVTVTYGRTIDDLPVIGPGSKIVVHVGENGAVMGAVRRWRELDKRARHEVQPQEMVAQREAEELARRQILSQYGASASFKITGSGKAYYDNNGAVLQPVYVFETVIDLTATDRRIPPFPYLCVVPLLRNSPEPLNLTTVDPRAKELLRTPPKGETRPRPPVDRKTVD